MRTFFAIVAALLLLPLSALAEGRVPGPSECVNDYENGLLVYSWCGWNDAPASQATLDYINEQRANPDEHNVDDDECELEDIDCELDE